MIDVVWYTRVTNDYMDQLIEGKRNKNISKIKNYIIINNLIELKRCYSIYDKYVRGYLYRYNIFFYIFIYLVIYLGVLTCLFLALSLSLPHQFIQYLQQGGDYVDPRISLMLSSWVGLTLFVYAVTVTASFFSLLKKMVLP